MKKSEVVLYRTIKEFVSEKNINQLINIFSKTTEKNEILKTFFSKAVKQSAGCSLNGGLKKISASLDGKKLSKRLKNINNGEELEKVDFTQDFFSISDKFILSEIVSLIHSNCTCIYCGITDEFYFYKKSDVKSYGLFIKEVQENFKIIKSLQGETQELKVKNSVLVKWNNEINENFKVLLDYLKAVQKKEQVKTA